MRALVLPLLCFVVVNSQVSNDLHGYRFMTNIDSRLSVKKDFDQFNDLLNAHEWAKALEVFKNGNQSTISIFSLADQAPGDKYFDLQREYYGTATPSKSVVLAALQSTGVYSNVDEYFRDETASKVGGSSALYGAIYHELELGLKACRRGDDSMDIVKHVDIAWAYFGTLFLPGLVARCARTDSCLEDGVMRSTITNELLALFTQAQVSGITQDCMRFEETYQRIFEIQSITPLQNTLICLGNTTVDGRLSQLNTGQAYGFTFSLIPVIAKCNSAAASVLRNSFDPAVSANGLSKTSKDQVFAAIVTAIGCLNLKCSHFAFGTCIDDDVQSNSTGLDGGQIAGIVIGVVAFYLLSIVIVAIFTKRRTLAHADDYLSQGLDGNRGGHHKSLNKA